jgi:hypothetical protein
MRNRIEQFIAGFIIGGAITASALFILISFLIFAPAAIMICTGFAISWAIKVWDESK